MSGQYDHDWLDVSDVAEANVEGSMRLWSLPTYILAHRRAAWMVGVAALGGTLAICQRVQATMFYGGVEVV